MSLYLKSSIDEQYIFLTFFWNFLKLCKLLLIKNIFLTNYYFIFHYREASTVWNSSSKLGLVSEGLLKDLFHQLNFSPTKEQGWKTINLFKPADFDFVIFPVNDMLRNAKLYSSNMRFCNGLSFGEFAVLAADYRKFRYFLFLIK